MGVFADTSSGRERWSSRVRIPRHRHAEAYAALVLSGGYEECGSRGRFRVSPGDVLLHRPFDAHLDRFSHRGAQLLNLICPALNRSSFGLGYIADVDAIVRAAERDILAAGMLLCEKIVPRPSAPLCWTERLAQDLLANPSCRLDAWADTHGLAAETVSRGFGRMFGVTPAAFRAEARARRAFGEIVEHARPLSAVAAHAGFADQAHMTRAVKALTGLSPGEWRRRSNRFKTAHLALA